MCLLVWCDVKVLFTLGFKDGETTFWAGLH